MRVTFDTNLIGEAHLLETAKARLIDVAFVSVSDREVEGTSFERGVDAATTVAEISVWGESRWGEGTWGDDAPLDCFEIALRVISGGSFPPKGARGDLTGGQRRQLRDAMIFCSHVRDKRDVFVTRDEKGFVSGGRREKLQQVFATRILTPGEFLAEIDRSVDV
jgi:hypothetical protein